MKKISVIIPCFNSRETLEACIESVIATGCAPLEIIVVNDASTDDTPSIARRLIAAHPGLVRLEELPANRGPATARNAGAKIAEGDYLFFLDSDTQLLPDALRRFITLIEESGAASVSGMYHGEPLNSGACAAYKALLNSYFFQREGVFEFEVFNGAIAGVRREIFMALGGYNEALCWGMDYENEELGHRMHAQHRMLCDPLIQARHAFPDFAKLTRTYFMRVSLWIEVFMRRRKFENGGLATGGSAAATLSVPLFFASLPVAALWPPAGLLSLCCLGLYLRGYGPFLVHVAKQRPALLVPAFVINLWCSLVISAGAAYGAARVLVGAGRTNEYGLPGGTQRQAGSSP
jgi:glycosyltransferase involved in cell wall biosynthesis